MTKSDKISKLMEGLKKADYYGVRIALGLMFIVSIVLLVATTGIWFANDSLKNAWAGIPTLKFILDNSTALLLVESSILIVTSVIYAAQSMKQMAKNAKDTQDSFERAADSSTETVEDMATIIDEIVKGSVNDLGTVVHSTLNIKSSFIDFILKDKESVKKAVPEILGSFKNYLSSWTSFTDGFYSKANGKNGHSEELLALTGLNIMKTCFLEDASLLFENKIIPDEKKYLMITIETFLSLAEQLNNEEDECLVVYSVTDQHPLHFFNYPHTADDQTGKFYFENIHVATYNRVMAMIFDEYEENIEHIRIILPKDGQSYKDIKKSLQENLAFCCPIPLDDTVLEADSFCKEYGELFIKYADESEYGKYFSTIRKQSVLCTYKDPLHDMGKIDDMLEASFVQIHWEKIFGKSRDHFSVKYDQLCNILEKIAEIIERKTSHLMKEVYTKNLFDENVRHDYTLEKIRKVQRFLADVWVLKSKTIYKNDELNKILDNGLKSVMKDSLKPDSGMDDVFEYYVYLLSTCYWFERSEKNGLHKKADKLQNVFIKNFHNKGFFYLLDVESIKKGNKDIQLKDALKKIPTEFTLFGLSSQTRPIYNMPESDWKLAIGLHKRPFSNLTLLKMVHENSNDNELSTYTDFAREFEKNNTQEKWIETLINPDEDR